MHLILGHFIVKNIIIQNIFIVLTADYNKNP